MTSCNQGNRGVSAVSAPVRSFSGNILEKYFLMMCTITKSTAGFYGPQTARAYSYVGIAGYEAVVHGIGGARSLAGQLNGLSSLPQPDSRLEYNWAISANTAVAQMMRDMFIASKISSANDESINVLEQSNLKSLSKGVGQDVIARSVQFGKAITKAIYEASLTDGGNQSYLDPFQLPYTSTKASGDWVPTGTLTTPVAPYWGKNRPFLTADINKLMPNAPVPFSTDQHSDFYKEAMLVYKQVKHNTPDQVAISKFWSDDPFNTCTPTGHTFNIMVQLLKENHATLEKAAVALAKLSIATNDAFISCWKVKYTYNTMRPVTYIRKYIDPAFTSLTEAPAYPAYTGGHAYESGAGSIIFINLFTNGNGNYHFIDYSQLQYGYPARVYKNFNDMALECANSRFYGGIHYNADNVEGLRLGRMIGDNVNKLIAWPSDIK
jgi:hypothetical protein